MRQVLVTTLVGVALLALSSCDSGSDAPETSKEHVWKGQTKAIDKAREVETILQRDKERKDQQQ